MRAEALMALSRYLLALGDIKFKKADETCSVTRLGNLGVARTP